MQKAMDAAQALLRFLPFMHERFLHPMEREADISKLQLFTLMTLYRKGAHTMSGLAVCMHISKQQLSQLVDRLLEQGLLEREADAQDRRVIRIRISSAGVRMIEERMLLNQKRLADKLDNLPQQDLEDLEAMMARIMELLDRAERLASGKETEGGEHNG